jgi:aspartate kinase
MRGREGQRIVVVKLGGSILRDRESYQQASRFILRRLHRCEDERFVIVVSAQYGLTDELEKLARAITSCPNPRTLDLLWSTGETRSVAMLTLHLEELGIRVAGLNIHETGLCLSDAAAGRAEVQTVSRQIEQALEQHSVIVVPGFFGTREGGMIASLGRGGSDLSAVLLAEGLDAARCELVKDVRGYFTADPNVDPEAKHIPQLSYERALRMADAGCELVQARALEAARIASLRIVVCGLDESAPASVISTDVGAEASAASGGWRSPGVTWLRG